MALLREVIARFAVEVDDGPMTQLDQKIEKAKQRVSSFATAAVAVFSAAAYASYQFVDAASSVNEELNVTEQIFGKNKDAMVAWSKTASQAFSRSEHDLLRYANSFGTFFEPQLRGTNEDIEKMSQTMAQLGVDIASMFNTTDEEAFMRLKSGLQGETEAVRRIGIDISDTALDDLNKKSGDHRRLASLTLQEKTLLRYRKILIDTSKVQGDAIRTADGFANQVRKLDGNVQNLKVSLGKVLLPTALSVVKVFQTAADGFIWVNEKTESLRAAFVVFGGAVGAAMLNSKIAIAAFEVVASRAFLVLGAKLAALTTAFLLVEDVFSAFSGKTSVFETGLKVITGLKAPLLLYRDMAQDIANFFHNAFEYAKATGQVLRGGSWNPDIWDAQRVADHRKKESDAAVLRGDVEAYKRIHALEGRTPQENRTNFLKDRRRLALANTPGMRLTQQDVDAGLITKDVLAYQQADIAGAQAAKKAGGASYRIPNRAWIDQPGQPLSLLQMSGTRAPGQTLIGSANPTLPAGAETRNGAQIQAIKLEAKIVLDAEQAAAREMLQGGAMEPLKKVVGEMFQQVFRQADDSMRKPAGR